MDGLIEAIAELFIEIGVLLFEEFTVPMCRGVWYLLKGICYPFVWVWRKIERGYQWVSGNENV